MSRVRMIRIRVAAEKLETAKTELEKECQEAWRDGDSVRRIAHAANVNFHTAKKWVST